MDHPETADELEFVDVTPSTSRQTEVFQSRVGTQTVATTSARNLPTRTGTTRLFTIAS